MRKAKRACIIGSGPSGLVACKELVAAGFECAVYEKQSGLGGAFATCYEGFLFTTSTHLSAFSDIPEDKPSRHWSATEFISYCSRYVEHFKLQKHLVFNACVTSVKRKASGQFDVAINNAVESEVFDFVVLCSGLNHAPKAEMIHSSAVHSSTIRDFDQFAGKRVLIVGGGESASDLTLLLMQSGRAKSVCVSVRSAASQGWMVARTYGKNKTPSDVDTTWAIHQMSHSFKKFFFDYVTPIVSWLRFGVNVFKRRQEGSLFWNESLTQSRWNAGKSIDRTFGVKSNSIITAVKLGASLAPGIEKIENGVAVFVDGKTFEFDCIVSCTGFQVNLWFLECEADREYLSRSDKLFWHMLSPHVENMAVIGFLRPSFGVVLTVAELQSRFLAQLWSGKQHVTNASMQRQIERQVADRVARYGIRLASQIPALEEFLPSLEGLSGLVGCRPSMARYLFWDPKLWFHLVFGPLISARYRLEGPDSDYASARSVLLNYSWSEGYIGVLSFYALLPSTLSFIVEKVSGWFRSFLV